MKLIDFNNSHQVNIEFIKNLNIDLDSLRSKLIEYLQLEQNKKDIVPDQKYINLFINGIDDVKDDIIILNFNYTDTAERYLRIIEKKLNDKFYYLGEEEYKGFIKCFNIHGQLESASEEPIFGIGDEYNFEYNKIKELDDIDEILKYSKSFWYQKNNNYQNFMKILESYKPDTFDKYTFETKFNLEIYGHSCGLSDRTLLKNIFEHESINSIVLYHYPDRESYILKTYDVWRHFDNAHLFRMKLKPYDENHKMPQIKVQQNAN